MRANRLAPVVSGVQGRLAWAHAGLGQLDEALDALEDAVASAGEGTMVRCGMSRSCSNSKVRCCSGRPRIDRLRRPKIASNMAGEMAREHGALFWELRIALSVARLRITQARHAEVREMLAPVHDRFTDGFATADLRAARTMLDRVP